MSHIRLGTFFLLLSSATVSTTWADVLPARQQELVHLLKHDCGSCHGITLKGGLGLPLTPEALAGKPVELLENIINNGLPDTAMPPWNQILSAEEIRWLVHYMTKGNTP